jgi:hypothetical protein
MSVSSTILYDTLSLSTSNGCSVGNGTSLIFPVGPAADVTFPPELTTPSTDDVEAVEEEFVCWAPPLCLLTTSSTTASSSPGVDDGVVVDVVLVKSSHAWCGLTDGVACDELLVIASDAEWSSTT